MILVDYNGILFSDIAIGSKYTTEFNKKTIAKLMLSSILNIAKQFAGEYGKLVLCNDYGNYWRRDFFPHYKAGRAERREQDLKIDWNEVFKYANEVEEDFKNILPCKILRINKLEADDIIAILTKKYHDTEKILIVSNDKDFAQLHKYSNVEQYYPMKKVKTRVENAEDFLKELIVHGDKCDGIANIRSPLDTFVNKKRQTAITTAFMRKIYSGESLDAFEAQRLDENTTLIDFDRIPEEYTDIVLSTYENTKTSENRQKLWEYCIQNKVSDTMIDSINELYK